MQPQTPVRARRLGANNSIVAIKIVFHSEHTAKYDVADGSDDGALGEHWQRECAPNDGAGHSNDAHDAGQC